MGNYSAIKDVGDTLKGLLESISWEDMGLTETEKPKIVLKSPRELEKETNKYLISLFLYQIQENIHLKNQEIQQADSARLGYQPISLDLFYLIIPYLGKEPSDQDRETEHRMLGKIIQKFYDNSILSGSALKGSLQGTDEELRLILNPISLDDLSKLWTSFTETPFRLLVSYLVTPVRIESTREIEIRRVSKKETGYYQTEDRA